MTEYAVIAGLCVLVAIPVLALLGGHMNVRFDGMIPAYQPAQITHANAPSSGGPGPITPSPISPQGQTSGTWINNQALGREVQTAGANGATTVLASQLELLGKQQLEAGQISQAQYTQMLALANQGHRLANMEGLLENVVSGLRSAQDFSDQTVVFEGKEYEVSDLIAQLGFHQSYDDGLLSNPMQSANLANPEMKTFINLYNQVVSSGALENPATQAEVQRLATQIATINDAFVYAAQDLGWDYTIQPEEFTSSAAERIMNLDASTTTHNGSTSICRYGNGQDSGKNCSG